MFWFKNMRLIVLGCLIACSSGTQGIAGPNGHDGVNGTDGRDGINGMGCQGRIVTSLLITDTTDMSSVADVCAILGSLQIHTQTHAEVVLPRLRSVGGGVAINHAIRLRGLKMPALEFIGRDLILQESAINLFELNALSTVDGEIRIKHNPYLKDIRLGSLVSVGNNITVIDNQSLMHIDMNMLDRVDGSLNIGISEEVLYYALQNYWSSPHFVTNNPKLVMLDVDRLTYIAGSLRVIGSDDLTMLNIPHLVTVEAALVIANNAELQSVEMPELFSYGLVDYYDHLGYSLVRFQISDNAKLIDIDMHNLINRRFGGPGYIAGNDPNLVCDVDDLMFVHDCGPGTCDGACPKQDEGTDCSNHDQCLSHFCKIEENNNKRCRDIPTCMDGIFNGDEVGVDCGVACNNECEFLCRTINGDFKITNSNLHELDNVCVIKGSLHIAEGTSLTDLSLPKLQHVDNIWLSQLSHLKTIDMPALKLSNLIYIASTNVVSISFPHLIKVGNLRIGENFDLAALNLHNLIDVESLSISDTLLTEIDLSNLISVDLLSIGSNAELTQMNFSVLSRVGNVEIWDNADLVDVNFHHLTSVRNIRISRNASLTQINLPRCIRAESFIAHENSLLQNLTLKSFSAAMRIDISNNDSLEYIDMPALASTRSLLRIEDNLKLADVSMPHLRHTLGSGLSIKNNAPLITCHGDYFSQGSCEHIPW